MNLRGKLRIKFIFIVVVVVLAFLNLIFKDEFSHKSKDHDILLNKLIKEKAYFNSYKAKLYHIKKSACFHVSPPLEN